jgi:hypothetical protein
LINLLDTNRRFGLRDNDGFRAAAPPRFLTLRDRATC